jgi:dihydropteroate synthase
MGRELRDDPVFGRLALEMQPRVVGLPRVAVPGTRALVAEAMVGVVYRRAGLGEADARELARQVLVHRHEEDEEHDLCFGMVARLLAKARERPAFGVLVAAFEAGQARPKAPRMMGVVNVTPDSFSDGGRFADAEGAIEHGLALEAQGAQVLDVGGESTRPGSAAVSVEEELGRTIPVISALAKRAKVPVSVDTTKAGVARAALDAGATIVNDISAGRWDAAMLPLVAERGATFVAMHMQGTPQDMQRDPRYGDVVAEVLEFLRERGAACLGAGIARERIWIDPGIGFGKTLDHNLELLRRLPELRSLGLPVLVGVSRKAFIARIHGPAREDVARIGGTAAAVALAVQGGAEILRVHDVAVMAEAAAVARAVAGPPSA